MYPNVFINGQSNRLSQTTQTSTLGRLPRRLLLKAEVLRGDVYFMVAGDTPLGLLLSPQFTLYPLAD